MTKPQVGLVGLGTMGAALALNIAEKGFPIAVWNRTTSVTHDVPRRGRGPCRTDRADRDAGRSGRRDGVTARDHPDGPRGKRRSMTSLRRWSRFWPRGSGDRRGQCQLPRHQPSRARRDCRSASWASASRAARRARGTAPRSWRAAAPRTGRAWPVLQAIAAKAEDGTPCADHMGPAGAGHFVKAVHNGIEYADMQMIAETYGVMRDGLGMGAADIAAVFRPLERGRAAVLPGRDLGQGRRGDGPHRGRAASGHDPRCAGQKGTGRWTAIEAQNLARRSR
jgi:6-phosphogluconate dehydrogenase